MDTRGRLLRAAERLFAENGVHGVTVRQLNAAAGVRNTSALHYHFGSRDGLVRAIVERHQAEVDADRLSRLDRLPPDPTVRDLVALVLEPLAGRLGSASGRDYLRIVPQVLDMPDLQPPALAKVTAMLAERLARPDRLLPMLRASTTLLADRASRPGPHDEFVADLVSMATGMLTAD